MSIFSEKLKALRKEQHLNQETVAVKCGVAYSTYRRYESGEREPALSSLCDIADFFGVSLDYLAGRTEKREVNR